MICEIVFLFVLDYFAEELFKARERIIEISIEKDHYYDSVSDLEKNLHLSGKNFRKLQKQFDNFKKLHSNCSRRVFLYR